MFVALLEKCKAQLGRYYNDLVGNIIHFVAASVIRKPNAVWKKMNSSNVKSFTKPF